MNFNPESKIKESINPLKNEHLRDAKPIIGCICDRNNLDRETEDFLSHFRNDGNTDLIDWEFSEFEARKNGINKFENHTYIISSCDNKDKYSTNFLDCTGVVASAVDKRTGKNISFMSHQNPEGILDDNISHKKFEKELIESLNYLIENSIPGTVDVVVFGGNKQDVLDSFPEEDYKPWIHGVDDVDHIIKGPFYDYVNSIKFLNHIISEKVGFSPVVISGPNQNFNGKNHSLSVYFDNENRRLYMVRPKNENINNESFVSSGVDDQINKIKK